MDAGRLTRFVENSTSQSPPIGRSNQPRNCGRVRRRWCSTDRTLEDRPIQSEQSRIVSNPKVASVIHFRSFRNFDKSQLTQERTNAVTIRYLRRRIEPKAARRGRRLKGSHRVRKNTTAPGSVGLPTLVSEETLSRPEVPIQGFRPCPSFRKKISLLSGAEAYHAEGEQSYADQRERNRLGNCCRGDRHRVRTGVIACALVGRQCGEQLLVGNVKLRSENRNEGTGVPCHAVHCLADYPE